MSPIQITPELSFKNRIIKAPQSTWYWNEDGTVSQRAMDFYEAIAAGGAGMMVISAVNWTLPQKDGVYACMYDDTFMEGWYEFIGRMHKHGCKVFAQLHHIGPAGPSNFDGGPPVGPSTLSQEELPSPFPINVPVRGLSKQEIKDNLQLYWKAAERVKEVGFDGIEVHCAHAYYFESFLSKVWNKRTDEYGPQSMENRARIVIEAIRGLKERVGEDYPLGMRINGREWGHENALTTAECVEFAKMFEAEGIIYFSVSGYGYGENPFRYLPDYWPYPEPDGFMKKYMDDYKGQGLFVPSAMAIKQAVNVPVAVAGRLNEDLAEELLRQGKVDFIALGRTLWADPEFPHKVADGRIEDIVRCSRCGTCEDPVIGPRRCRVNPSMGREAALAIKAAEHKKRVMVIGGGPAGMEAARVASLRGHEVTLYEKESKLGGKIPLASMIKGSEVEDVIPIIEYLRTQVEKLKIKVKLGHAVTADTVRKEKPDAVVLAVGGIYELPRIPGIGQNHVSSVNSLFGMVRPFLKLFGPKKLSSMTHIFLPIGKKVIVIGGQIEGCQGAVFLGKRGRTVTILESTDKIGTGIPPKLLARMSSWFEQKGIKVITELEYEEITDKGVYIKKDGERKLIEGDSIMVLPSQIPNNELSEELTRTVPEVHLIGSARGSEAGSLIVDALLSARTIGCQI